MSLPLPSIVRRRNITNCHSKLPALNKRPLPPSLLLTASPPPNPRTNYRTMETHAADILLLVLYTLAAGCTGAYLWLKYLDDLWDEVDKLRLEMDDIRRTLKRDGDGAHADKGKEQVREEDGEEDGMMG
jgi:hypothetical protein